MATHTNRSNENDGLMEETAALISPPGQGIEREGACNVAVQQRF